MTRKRHKWGAEPQRLEYETIRTCTVCGLRKITDHGMRPPKIYFLEGASTEQIDVMPECEMVE